MSRLKKLVCCVMLTVLLLVGCSQQPIVDNRPPTEVTEVVEAKVVEVTRVDNVPRRYEVFVVDKSSILGDYGPEMYVLTSTDLVFPSNQHDRAGHGWILDGVEYREGDRSNGIVGIVKKTIVRPEALDDFVWSVENDQVPYNYSSVDIHEGYRTDVWSTVFQLPREKTYYFKEAGVVNIDTVEYFHIPIALEYNIDQRDITRLRVYELWVRAGFTR